MVIQGVADIVLWILKSNDKFNNPIDKRVEIEKVLDKITLSTWDDDKESVENEEDSGGFKESENLLAMASAPRDLPDHHRSLFSSRKGGVDRSVVEEKSSHDKGYTPGEWASTNFYKPTRQDTKQALQNLRSLVVDRLGEFGPIVLLGVTDIVLWILKSDHHDFKTPTHKRAQIEKLLNPIADQVFEQMLQTTQLITDYSTHPYEFEFHNDRPLASMEAIVAYNLLVWAYRDGPWRRSPPPQRVYRKKAYEMVLILNNESAKSSDEQRELISNLLYGVSDHIVRDLLVFVISKLFPEFVVRWDKVVFNIVPAKIYVDSRVGSSSIDVKVIDTLVVFGWMVLESRRFWDYDEGADHEEEGDSGAFEESENKLRSAGASAPRDGPDHHRREGNGDRPVEAKGSRSTDSRDHVEMKNGCSIC
ncbi:hypothetical protein Syun_008034 [Stephania yunnanensis]|uniref:Uncharacterized protein n=1 Tax=Stephania yunnanensis TaxID=152371 RepID=A0AAP0PZC6_9MAGN